MTGWEGRVRHFRPLRVEGPGPILQSERETHARQRADAGKTAGELFRVDWRAMTSVDLN